VLRSLDIDKLRRKIFLQVGRKNYSETKVDAESVVMCVRLSTFPSTAANDKANEGEISL